MRIKLSCFLSLLIISSATLPTFADNKHSQLDKTLEMAQKAFDSGNFPKAERTWLRAESALNKTGAKDERLGRVLELLGDCFYKEGKFSKAHPYKQALETMQGLTLDTTAPAAKLKELAAFYRPINLEGFDDNATAFAKQVGATSAGALNKDEKRHIDINLQKRFQQSIKKLLESAPANITDKLSDSKNQIMNDAAIAGANSPPVEQIRLDKLIAFDLVRGESAGKIKLANIQGIFINVGLWVKLKEFVMLMDEQNNPQAEVTAGAFGVDKTVHVKLPANLCERLRLGLDKFDPFIATTNTNQNANANANPNANANATQSAAPARDGATAKPSNSALPPTSTLPNNTAPQL